MAEQMRFSFNIANATDFMRTMFHLEAQRDELNEAINIARSEAREIGVPTKAVEAAIKAAKGRRKSGLSPAEFQKLMDLAEGMMPKDEEDVQARETVYDAAKKLHPDNMSEGIDAITFATEGKSVTLTKTGRSIPDMTKE